MKKLLSIVSILLVLCMTFSACGGASDTEADTDADTVETDAETPEETETDAPEEDIYVERTYTMADAEGLYNPLGRTAMKGSSLTCDWTASGAEFVAECSGDVKITFTSSSSSHCLTVIVDGEVTKDFALTSGTKVYTIAEDLEEGVHNIKIVAQYAYSTASLDKISLTGILREAEEKDVYIEFIGDSITCGSGLSTAGTNDGTKAFAYVAADILGVDYSICSNGGMGVAFSAGDGTNVVNNVYPYQNAKRDNTAYAPTRTPDLIVINLHTNDNWQWYSQAKNQTDHETFNYDNFDKAFDEFISTIDSLYGEKEVPIVFVFGCMANSSYTMATDRIYQLIDEKYLPEGYDMETVTLTTDRTGASSHPAPAGAQKQGEELADFLKSTYIDIFG